MNKKGYKKEKIEKSRQSQPPNGVTVDFNFFAPWQHQMMFKCIGMKDCTRIATKIVKIIIVLRGLLPLFR